MSELLELRLHSNRISVELLEWMDAFLAVD